MQKFKKYAKKCISFVLISALITSLFTVLCITVSADSNVITIDRLDDIFDEKDSGVIIFNSSTPGGLGGGFYDNLRPGGHFEIIPDTGGIPDSYSVIGNFKNLYSFDPSFYYTISIPLSFSTNYLNMSEYSLRLIDIHGNFYSFKRVNAIWPDPKGSTSNDGKAQYVTVYFEATFSGAFLTEVVAYSLTISGNNYLGSGVSYGGLLYPNVVTITTTSKIDYDSVYGDPNTDYNQPSSDSQDKLHGLEDELINDEGLNNIGDFFSDSGNGGNSIVNISNGLQAAGVLFAELFNFNGERYTIFNMLINFSLTLGMVCFLLNLAPKVFGGSSRSKNKNNKGSKGGRKN